MAPRTHEQYIEITNRRTGQIKKVALKLFANEGYHSTSISEIAKRTNISKGLMYHYYNSKEELLKAIVMEGFEQIKTSLYKYITQYSYITDLQLFIKTIFDLLENNVLYFKLFLRIILNQLNENSFFFNELQYIVQPISKITTNFFQELGIPDPENETELFLSTFLGITMKYQSSINKVQLDKLQNIIIQKYSKNERNISQYINRED